jgi:dTDP-glucose 4,6-dehydratase
MKETIEWYLNNMEWIENIVSGDYANYYEKMYSGIDQVAATKEK